MLAKLWKKVLLAVCIIACIFNIMYKLVNRTSLEVNLNSANDGNTVFDFTRKDNKTIEAGNSDEIDANTTEPETPAIKENTKNSSNKKETTSRNTVSIPEKNEEVEQEKETSEGVKYKDLTSDITFVELF